MLLRGALLALMAVAWTSSVSALCAGGFWTDCADPYPNCDEQGEFHKGEFHNTRNSCHWGALDDCPSLCGWAWVSSGREFADVAD